MLIRVLESLERWIDRVLGALLAALVNGGARLMRRGRHRHWRREHQGPPSQT